MAYLGTRNLGDVLTFTVNTHDVDTGVATDATSAPTYRVYEDETPTPIATGTMATLDGTNTTGFYSEQLTLTSTPYDDGKSYSIYISATVDGVTATTSHNFQVQIQDVNVVTVAGTTQTANDNGADINTLITQIGTAGAGLTDLGGMSTAMKAEVNTEADTAITDAALATAANLATVDTVVDGIQTDLSNATDGLGAIKTDTAAILVDTGTTIPATITTLDTNVDAILVDTATTIPGLISALQTDLDTLTDATTEPTGVPGVSETLVDKVGYLYMALRNQVTVTSTKKTFFDDSGTAEWEKDLSDDGTTYTETEGNAI